MTQGLGYRGQGLLFVCRGFIDLEGGDHLIPVRVLNTIEFPIPPEPLSKTSVSSPGPVLDPYTTQGNSEGEGFIDCLLYPLGPILESQYRPSINPIRERG